MRTGCLKFPGDTRRIIEFFFPLDIEWLTSSLLLILWVYQTLVDLYSSVKYMVERASSLHYPFFALIGLSVARNAWIHPFVLW